MNTLSLKELDAELSNGSKVAPADLAGYAFHGVSLGLPDLVDRLMWKTFAKVFAWERGEVRGFNLRIVQGASTYRPRARRPRFGEFVAIAKSDLTILDYSRANPPWHPLARLRDELVATGNNTYLGRAYLSIAGRRINTPSYFTLTRGPALPTDTTFGELYLRLSDL